MVWNHFKHLITNCWNASPFCMISLGISHLYWIEIPAVSILINYYMNIISGVYHISLATRSINFFASYSSGQRDWRRTFYQQSGCTSSYVHHIIFMKRSSIHWCWCTVLTGHWDRQRGLLCQKNIGKWW